MNRESLLQFAHDRFDSGSCSELDQAPRFKVTRSFTGADSIASMHTVSSEPLLRRSDFIPIFPKRTSSQQAPRPQQRRPTKRDAGATRRNITWGRNTASPPCVSRDPQNSMLLLSCAKAPTQQLVSCVCCTADLIVDMPAARYNSTLESLLVQCPHCTAVTCMPVNAPTQHPRDYQRHQAQERLALLCWDAA
jgi:hypothetical protein